MAETIAENRTARIVACCRDNGRSAIEFIKRYPFSIVSVAVAFFIALLSFDYIDCISVTTWTLSVWDALFDGRLLEYSEVTFENMRGAPHGGDTGGFLMSLPWAIWNFPLWITHLTPGNYSIDNPACIIWSKLFLILCLFLASYYVKKLSFMVTDDRTVSEYGFILCLTAGTAIISVGYAGQNEVIYVTSFLASVYYHIEGRKILSLCLMVYSLGCFPLLVIPLLMILLIRNVGVVKSILIAGVELLAAMFLFGIGGSSSSVDSYGSLVEYIDWFFYRTYIISAEGTISFFMVSVVLLLLYCIFKKKEDVMHASIICLALFFTSMLIFSWMHFYRYYICLPAMILSLMLLYRTDRNLFNIGLIVFTIINFASCIVACQDVNCWNYRYFQGLLSDFFSINCPNNFFWALFGDNTLKIGNLILSGMVAVCLFYSYILIKRPTGFVEVKVKEKAFVFINAMCPLFLIMIYFIVPVIV